MFAHYQAKSPGAQLLRGFGTNTRRFQNLNLAWRTMFGRGAKLPCDQPICPKGFSPKDAWPIFNISTPPPARNLYAFPLVSDKETRIPAPPRMMRVLLSSTNPAKRKIAETSRTVCQVC